VKSRSYSHSVGTFGYAEPSRTLRIMPEGVGFSGFLVGGFSEDSVSDIWLLWFSNGGYWIKGV
jgi:hypothetical protein